MGSLGASDGGPLPPPPPQIESGLWWGMRLRDRTGRSVGPELGSRIRTWVLGPCARLDFETKSLVGSSHGSDSSLWVWCFESCSNIVLYYFFFFSFYQVIKVKHV